MSSLNGKILLKVKEVAERLNLSKTTVYDYAKVGIIKAIYLPSAKESQAVKHNRKAIRFTIESINQFLHNLGVDGFDVKEVP